MGWIINSASGSNLGTLTSSGSPLDQRRVTAMAALAVQKKVHCSI